VLVDSEDGLELGWVEKCMTLHGGYQPGGGSHDRDASDSWNAKVTESQSESLLLVPLSFVKAFATATLAPEYTSASHSLNDKSPKAILF
jgi:hypothetical protein